MSPGRRACRQQFLGYNIALELRALVSSVLFGPRHADPALGTDLAAELARERPFATIRREGSGLRLLAQKHPYLLAQFLGLGRQFDRVEAEAEIHRCLTIPLYFCACFYEPWVMKGQSWSAPCAATILPSRWAHIASLPNSSRHAHSRRVAWCSECS